MMNSAMELFARDNIVGVFRGFREGGLEFQADLVLPYRNEFQSIPMHGQFLLVQLETPTEAVLGRIASFSSEGKLSFGSGEEFNIRALRENREVPEDLREQYLKYRVTIRVLGVLRQNGVSRLTFVASHRRLAHVGSPVAFPPPALLQEIDHFEGRSYPGWTHHTVLTAIAFTFLQLERMRAGDEPRPTLPHVRLWVREIMAVLYVVNNRKLMNLIVSFQRNPPMRR
jgi:hypothetical protein